MSRLGRRLGAVALSFVAVLAGVFIGAGPAAAAPLPIGQCTTSSGVILAVDFSHWGGPLLRSCGTTPTTGYQLLNQGGWATTGTHHDGPAFICRIGYSGYQGGTQYPTPAQDSCVLTPPATAYWSYWHANPGDTTWSYSQLGAMSYKPLPGSVDLWIFGGTNIEGTEGRPTFSPDSVRALNTTPAGTTTPPPPRSSAPAVPPPTTAPAPRTSAPAVPGSTAAASTAPTSCPSPSTSPTTAPAASPPAGACASSPTSPASGSDTPSATDGASSDALSPVEHAASGSKPTIAEAPPTTAPVAHSSGSATPAIAAGALVAAFGAGAGYLAWRRRDHADAQQDAD